MFFTVDDATFDKYNKIVIDAEAGIAKSSKTHAYLTEFKNEEYERGTSSHALRRDAEKRYNMKVRTIASGWFKTVNMRHYAEMKPPTSKYIVLDEILQTTPKIFEYANTFADENHKIIMLTDSHQLLAPENEECMMKSFNEYISQDDVLYIELEGTLRARDDETRALYDEFYKKALSSEMMNVAQLSKMFKVINFEDVKYESDKLFITHTKEIETFLYKTWNLSSRHDLELIGKGRIASKEKFDSYKYPIMSYSEAEQGKIQSHLEVANVGTTTRMQGRETSEGTYYFVEANSIISMRELYTMITRNWYASKIFIVIVDIEHKEKMKTFKGLPIKKEAFLTVDADETSIVSDKVMKSIFSENPDSETICYNKDVILCKHNPKIVAYATSKKKFKPGQLYYNKALNLILDEKPVENSRKSTAGSLIRKDATMNFSYCDEMYAVLDKVNGVNHLFGTHKLNARKKCNYQVDIYSAYMAVLSNCYMPADGFLSYEYDADMINVYLYEGKVLTNKSLITDELKNYVEEKCIGTCTYLFSVPKQEGCLLGSMLKAKAYKSIEDKKSLKDIHYGYYQKKYLELSSDKSCYIINESHKYEILMVVILSTLLYYMMRLSDEIGGSYICIDAVHFNNLENDTIDKIKSILPSWFDWRIKDNNSDSVVYQTYADLKTKEEVNNETRNANKRAKRANMTEEEKAAARAKNAERMRLARVKKKAEKEAAES